MSRKGQFRYVPLAEWPLEDRTAWLLALAKGDILEGEGPASHWAEATRKTNIAHYGRWLGFLESTRRPWRRRQLSRRACPQLVLRYITETKSAVAPRTVVSSLVGLKVMLKAMYPGAEWRWLEDHCNRLNRWASPQRDKLARMLPSEEIYATAVHELRRLAKTDFRRREHIVGYRDTLMVALMSARPLRLKNFSALRIGTSLVRENRGWALKIPKAEVKNKQRLEYSLPDSLLSLLEVYLRRVRPLLASSDDCDAVWLNWTGGPLSYHGIYYSFVRRTKALFGKPINPHLFRACAATSLATDSAAAAQSARPLLGHLRQETTDRYYKQARSLEASRKVNSVLAESLGPSGNLR